MADLRNQFGAYSEAAEPQVLQQRRYCLDQAVLSSPAQNPNSAGDRYTAANGLGSRTALVKQKQVCYRFFGEHYGFGFAPVQIRSQLPRSDRIRDNTNV